MFFRRMFARKDNNGVPNDNDDDDNDNEGGTDFRLDKNDKNNNNNNNNNINSFSSSSSSNGNNNGISNGDIKVQRSKYMPTTATGAGATTRHCGSATTLHRAMTSGSTTLQLTPLWEHILRTRTLPDSICPVKMFGEFLERLRDPEWQVRQHALRVLVDVLVVMQAKADVYMEPLITQLVENLGHQAPTVRRGALDCLRVYLAETGMAETVMLQVLDIGLNQKIINEPFGGRLTCGVMLSLPALVQATLHTPKRRFILRTTIDMLIHKMGQVTHQEITLKVLAKLKELIGEREFVDLMPHEALNEFELLCNIYGVGKDKAQMKNNSGNFGAANNAGGAWRQMSKQKTQADNCCWRSSEDDEESVINRVPAKVIMETEIKINDDTLTMRILEAKDDENSEAERDSTRTTHTFAYNYEDESLCGHAPNARKSFEETVETKADNRECAGEGSELHAVVTPSTPSRTPKRVTFGGEVVKMRTPDSDAASSNNGNKQTLSITILGESETDPGGGEQIADKGITAIMASSPTSPEETSSPESKTTALSVEITNDNTKPLPLTRPKTAQSPKRENQTSASSNLQHSSPAATSSPHSPVKRRDSNASLSPRSPFRRLSVSPVDSIISPKVPHKEIEVLHNLQRDPSPIRAKSARKLSATSDENVSEAPSDKKIEINFKSEPNTPPPPRTWEELGILDYDVIANLQSGDWRHRLQGVTQLTEALRSSENLALVQPCLDSLLRTLLSSERNPDVAEKKRRLLMNLISRLPLDNLENRTVQIMTGLCRQGGAGANRVCKSLMQRLPPTTIVLKLISPEFLHEKSSRFREHALQIVMYALMTFPSTYFDTTTCVTSATHAALNRKRRVRQAALDVLAILGQITSTNAVLDVVQRVCVTRNDGDFLMNAVKTRLSRKQLPLVTADGLVQYTLRIPTPTSGEEALKMNERLDADIEWINAGVGSVSPTSLKRRAYRNRSISQQSLYCLPPQQHDGVSICGSQKSNEAATRRHSFRSPVEVYGPTRNASNAQSNPASDETHFYNNQNVFINTAPLPYSLTGKKGHVDYSNHMSRRMAAKSCSDSSMDGRSSDSTYTSSSGAGSSGAVAVASCVAVDHDGGGDSGASGGGCGISGRFTRQPGNSRFPTMDHRADLNSNFYRVHKPPIYYPGMGAYAHLQQQQYNMFSTYPNKATHHRRTSNFPAQQQQQQHHQQQDEQMHYGNNGKNFLQQQYHLKQSSNNSSNNIQDNQHSKNQYNGNNNNNNSGSSDGTYTISKDITATTTTSTNSTAPMSKNSKKQQQQEQQQEEQKQQHQQKQQQHEEQPDTATATSSASSNNDNGERFVQLEQDAAQGKSSLKAEEIEDMESARKKQKSFHESPVSQMSQDVLMEGLTRSMSDLVLMETIEYSVPNSSPHKWTTGEKVLKIEHRTLTPKAHDGIFTVGDQDTPAKFVKRSSSQLSMQSKAESIKTQFEDTPPALSRTQSIKSLLIEEDLENDSFVVFNEELNNAGKKMIPGEFTGNVTRSSVSSKGSPVRSLNYNMEESDPNDSNEEQYMQENKKEISLMKLFKSPSLGTMKRAKTESPSRPLSRVKYASNHSLNDLGEKPQSINKGHAFNENSTDTSSISSGQRRYLKKSNLPSFAKKGTDNKLPLNRKNRRVSPLNKTTLVVTKPPLYPVTLKPFDKPREALAHMIEQLEGSNWIEIMEGLKAAVQLMRHHLPVLEAHGGSVCILLGNSVRNLRSQVSRAACQAAEEAFAHLKSNRLFEAESDELVGALLHRTADTNKFLRQDATNALASFVKNFNPIKVLNTLVNKGAIHQNALVRTATAFLLVEFTNQVGVEKIFSTQRDLRDKLILTGAKLLTEGSLETRENTKKIFKKLSEYPQYSRIMIEVIPIRLYRNIEKTLKSIK